MKNTIVRAVLLTIAFLFCMTTVGGAGPPRVSRTTSFAPESTSAKSMFNRPIFVLATTGIMFVVVLTLLVYSISKFRATAARPNLELQVKHPSEPFRTHNRTTIWERHLTAKYRWSGVVTFLVNQDGAAYEGDFGSKIDTAATDLASIEPGSSWSEAMVASSPLVRQVTQFIPQQPPEFRSNAIAWIAAFTTADRAERIAGGKP